MSRWMPVADWHDPYATKPPALRRLAVFEVYMDKRRTTRARARLYKIPPFDKVS